MRISSTCGEKRSITWRTIGCSPSRIKPLSTLPILRPWPPARINPVIPGEGGMAPERERCCDSNVGSKALGAGEQQEVLSRGAANHGHADLLRDVVSHLREARPQIGRASCRESLWISL